MTSGGFHEKLLPTDLWFFYDYRQPILYEITYIYISIAGFAVSFLILGSDLLFCGISTLIKAQFKIIAQDLREMEVKDIKETEIKLKKVIKLHQEILEIANEVDEIFGVSFLFNIGLSALVICTTGFQIFTLNIDNITEMLNFLLLFSPALVEIFLLCHHAEKVNDAALDIANAAYDFPWYEKNVPKSMRKTILQIMVTSQQGKKFKAYKFKNMSMETFSEVI